MRKSELIEKITAAQAALSPNDVMPPDLAMLSVEQILEYLANALTQKGRIEIRGLGNLTLQYQSAREAHNPKTGEKVSVPGKYKIRFKMGKDLKERLNKMK